MKKQENIEKIRKRLEKSSDITYEESDNMLEVFNYLVDRDTFLSLMQSHYTLVMHSNVDGYDYYIVGGNIGHGTDFDDAFRNAIKEKEKRGL